MDKRAFTDYPSQVYTITLVKRPSHLYYVAQFISYLAQNNTVSIIKTNWLIPFCRIKAAFVVGIT